MILVNGPEVVECGAGGPVPGPPPANGQTIVHVLAADDTPSRVLYDNWGRHTVISFRRAHGTRAAPAAIREGDTFGEMNGFGYGATGYSVHTRVKVTIGAAETWTDTAQGTFAEIWTTKKGEAAAQPRFRVEDDGGLTHNTRKVMTADSHPVLRGYAKTALPPASPAWQMIGVEDDGGGPCIAYSDGVNWRRMTDNSLVG